MLQDSKRLLTRRSAGTAATALTTRGADSCDADRRLRSARPASLFLFVDEQARTTTCTADAFLFSVCSWAVRGDVQHTIPWCASLAVTRSKFPDRATLRSREHADAVSTGSPPVGGAAAPRSEPSVAEWQGAWPCTDARLRLDQLSSGAAAHRCCCWRAGRHGPVRASARPPSARSTGWSFTRGSWFGPWRC